PALKRKLEQVIGKIEEVQIQAKRIRLQSEIWLSAPATEIETEKGRYVKERGTILNFPFQLTEMTRRSSPGKFNSPPDPELSEAKLQEYFISECKTFQTFDNSKLEVQDSLSIPLLATRKPDFVFIAKGDPLNALHVVAVGEIRKRSGVEFANADVGHAVSFGEKVLQLQPRRTFVYVVLTDCRVICIYKVTRCDAITNDNIRFSYQFIPMQKLTYDAKDTPSRGWKYLVTITECSKKQLGWIDPSLFFGSETVRLIRPISTGRTSIVYLGKRNEKETVVVKIAKSEDYLPCFIREKSVLETFSSLNSPHLQTLLLDDNGILVTTPYCEKVTNLRKEDIRNIINTLKVVHSQYNLVHMDLRKYNFLRNDNGDIVIIDWGYSVTKGQTRNFAGALECMPDDVLTSLVNWKQPFYSPKIDLICLARAFYLMLHKPARTIVERISSDRIPDFRSRAQNILDFWESNAKSGLWNRIFQLAEDLNYDGLIEALEIFFRS
ncbi:6518_t:CDS:2, partial [Acaulospora morrowiae]